MLKVAVTILIIMLAYATVYSVLGIIAPKVLLKSGVKAAIGKTLEDASADGYLKSLTGLQRGMNVFSLATVLSGFFVLFAAFKKAQKWAWFSFLVVGGIAWLGGLIISISVGDTMNLIMQLIGTVLLVLGLLLPIKSFFGQTAEEA
ncbi:hypothetical protein ACFL6S_16950 [Candidatus Poribacteria bacterium]